MGWHEDFYVLISKPEATEADMRLKVDEIAGLLGAYQSAQVDMRFELRDALLEEEWNEVFED